MNRFAFVAIFLFSGFSVFAQSTPEAALDKFLRIEDDFLNYLKESEPERAALHYNDDSLLKINLVRIVSNSMAGEYFDKWKAYILSETSYSLSQSSNFGWAFPLSPANEKKNARDFKMTECSATDGEAVYQFCGQIKESYLVGREADAEDLKNSLSDYFETEPEKIIFLPWDDTLGQVITAKAELRFAVHLVKTGETWKVSGVQRRVAKASFFVKKEMKTEHFLADRQR